MRREKSMTGIQEDYVEVHKMHYFTAADGSEALVSHRQVKEMHTGSKCLTLPSSSCAWSSWGWCSSSSCASLLLPGASAPSVGWTPSGCCSHSKCDHPPAACRQRSASAGPGGFLVYSKQAGVSNTFRQRQVIWNNRFIVLCWHDVLSYRHGWINHVKWIRNHFWYSGGIFPYFSSLLYGLKSQSNFCLCQISLNRRPGHLFEEIQYDKKKCTGWLEDRHLISSWHISYWPSTTSTRENIARVHFLHVYGPSHFGMVHKHVKSEQEQYFFRTDQVQGQ